MSTKHLLFAYSQENSLLTQNIDHLVGPYVGPITHLPGGRTTAAPSLSQQILDQPGKVVLFISDNFLKSAQCMTNGLRLLQNRGNDILPVVIPGIYTDEDTGETTEVETSFDRVSDIIQYINYWQDQYLDLRRQKRHLEEEIDEEKFNEHLKKMREISSEVGEFLRLLRTTDYISFQEFSYNDYEALFGFLGDLNARDEFRKNRPAVETSPPPATPIASESSLPELDETEAPDIDLGNIPGIDLLEDKVEETPEPTLEAITPEPTEPEEDLIGDASDLYQQELEEPSATEDPNDEAIQPESTIIVSETERTIEFDLHNQDAHNEEVQDYGEVYSDELIEELEEVSEKVEDAQPDGPQFGEEEVIVSNFGEQEASEAEDTYEEEEEEVSSSEEEAITVALEQISNGNVDHGFELVARLLDKYPHNANLRYQYAIALVQHHKDFTGAAYQLADAIRIEPQFEDAYFLLGELAEITEDFEGAKDAYQHLASMNPDYPQVQFRLGIVLANHFEDDVKEASKALKKAIKQDPENTDAYYQYAVLLNENADKPKKAIKYFKKTLESDPGHPFAWYDLALLYHTHGHRKKAHLAYLNAAEINPELKTLENDQAFFYQEKPESNVFEEPTDSFRERNTIDALKENIQKLEALLQEREEELQEESKKAEEIVLAQAPPRPGAGKTVFISGATSGIGRATAHAFAKQGYRLIINGRRTERLISLKNELETTQDVAVKILPFDVSDPDAVKQAIHQLEEAWHPIDLLINNAGKAKGYAPINEGELADWEEMINTNIKGLLYLTRTISPFMVARSEGHIINVCSSVGKEVYANGNVYCATKHAVDALTKSMRLDLLKHNIRVSQVSPAHVEETEFALVRFDGDADRAAKTYEGFQPLTAEDVAEAIYFIASQPRHVNVQDILMMGTQQASSSVINRSGRDIFEEEE